MTGRLVLIALTITILLGGCTVSIPNSTESRGTVVHGHSVVVDLTRKPTREDFGFRAGFNSQSYQRGFGGFEPADIPTTVILPTGTVAMPAFIVNAEAAELMSQAPLPPASVLVQRLFSSAQECYSALLTDAPVLGLDAGRLQQLLTRVGPTVGSGLPQQGVLDGFVRDWLSVEVTVIGYEDGDIGVNYEFTIDWFHNPAVDAVVHEGVYPLDLTRPPTRADLAFLPDRALADVNAPRDEGLRLRLTLPGGTVEHPIDWIGSSSESTGVSLTAGTNAELRAALLADVPVFGLDPAAVNAFLAASTATQTTFSGHPTPIYDVTVSATTDPARTDRYAASLRYKFVYRTPVAPS